MRPIQQRLRSVSGIFSELRPSKATVRIPAKHTPGVRGCASGLATTSNNALNGAAPNRRRSSRNAFSDTAGTTMPAPARPAHSFAHTRA
jgi:hypothetical protein